MVIGMFANPKFKTFLLKINIKILLLTCRIALSEHVAHYQLKIPIHPFRVFFKVTNLKYLEKKVNINLNLQATIIIRRSLRN
jgi:hypothetical protein